MLLAIWLSASDIILVLDSSERNAHKRTLLEVKYCYKYRNYDKSLNEFRLKPPTKNIRIDFDRAASHVAPSGQKNCGPVSLLTLMPSAAQIDKEVLFVCDIFRAALATESVARHVLKRAMADQAVTVCIRRLMPSCVGVFCSVAEQAVDNLEAIGAIDISDMLLAFLFLLVLFQIGT